MSVESTVSPSTATTRQPRRRAAHGPSRPQYLQAADVDQVMSMVMALMSEVSALRDRVDTHEALDGNEAAIEGYQLTDERRAVREARRHAMLKRVLRVFTEEMAAVSDDEYK